MIYTEDIFIKDLSTGTKNLQRVMGGLPGGK